MAVDFQIKKGDTRPAIQATISAAATDVLTTVLFYMSDKTGAHKVNAGAGTIVQQPSASQQAQVKYQWQAGDTDTAAVYNGEFEVTFNDGRIETYPNKKYLTIEVLESLR